MIQTKTETIQSEFWGGGGGASVGGEGGGGKRERRDGMVRVGREGGGAYVCMLPYHLERDQYHFLQLSEDTAVSDELTLLFCMHTVLTAI